MDADEIITNLKILALIQKGDRITTSSHYLNIEQRSIVPQFVRRWKANECRDNAIKKINVIVNNALLSKQDIIEYILKAIDGIRNLQETYTGDLQTISRLDTIIDKMITHTQVDR